MAAYMVVQSKVTDPEKMKKYGEAAIPLVRRFGGRPVAGGNVEVLEGSHDGRHFIIFEFPTIEDIRAFYAAPDYQEAKKIREGGATLDIWAVQGR